MYKSPISLLALMSLSGCICTAPPVDNRPTIGLSRFNSCEAMNQHLTDSLTQSFVGYGTALGGDVAVGMDTAESGSAESASPKSHSTTNVQEAGVDEPDMVKTDGSYIYLINDGGLSIVQSWPAEEAVEVGGLELEHTPDRMFLLEDRVLLYSSSWEQREDGSWGASTRLDVVDVSDRSRPEPVASKVIDGSLVSARMIGDDVYTVVNHQISLPDSAYSAIWMEMDELVEDHMWSDSMADRLRGQLRIKNRIRPIIANAVANMGIQNILPSVTHENGQKETIIGCTDVFHADNTSEAGLTTVAHIDLAAEQIEVSADATGVMAGSTTVYASADNLYVAQSSSAWWDGFSSIERTTRIHKFTLDGRQTEYHTSGEVDGYLHNQFSMSEHEGLLRVATTYDDWWWGTQSPSNKSGNNIFVLDAESDDMPLIGELTGLAPGEQIYATRFQGDRAFMVTFVQIDPLFTIDLSVPTQPEAKGELKIPGYSSYLHPIGEDHILGVGMNGTWDGITDNIAISLFDVSDFSQPKQQDQVTLDCDNSWSEALFDHHAILIHEDTVAIPAYGWNRDGHMQQTSGLMVAQIDTDTGLHTRGFVDHRPLVEMLYCAEDEACSETHYMPQMRRSLVIEDMLYSISDLGVMVSRLDEPETPIAMIPTI